MPGSLHKIEGISEAAQAATRMGKKRFCAFSTAAVSAEGSDGRRPLQDVSVVMENCFCSVLLRIYVGKRVRTNECAACQIRQGVIRGPVVDYEILC